MDKKYLIQVLTLDENILKYKVNEYTLEEGMVKFIDPKNGLIKSFPTSRTTIDEVEE
jgi:hypothetical protein